MQSKLAFILMAIMLNSSMNGLTGNAISSGTGDINDSKIVKCTVTELMGMSENNKVEESKEGKDSQEDVNNSKSEADEIPDTENKEIIDIVDDKKQEGQEAEEVLEVEEESDAKINDIYNVSFPTGASAHLDPGNLSGKGQIFSDEYKVENYGNTDIAIKIKNIDVHYWLRSEVYELSEEVADAYSGVKKLNINVVWKNEKENTEEVLKVVEGASDEYVLFLKAAQYDKEGDFVELNEGSVGTFYFTGTLSSDPWIIWEDDKMNIRFDYEIINANTKEGEEDLVKQEIPKEQEIIEEQDILENQEAVEESRILEEQEVVEKREILGEQGSMEEQEVFEEQEMIEKKEIVEEQVTSEEQIQDITDIKRGKEKLKNDIRGNEQ